MPEPKSSRSLSACQKGIEKALQALNEKKLSRTALSNKAGVGKTTLSNFLKGIPVDRANFYEICDKLDLRWEEIVGLEASPKTEDLISIDELVQSLRKQVSTQIQTRCGTMRVLDMTKPIGLDTIYTDVNILERITAKRGHHEVLKNFSPEDFDNFGLSTVKEKRLPGLEVAKKYGKLMLLGKPGAGKSTFLKRLAMLCSAGDFYADKVPCFVVLREFAEATGSPGLLKYLGKQLESPVAFERLIKAGKLLILLDGLDEVREEDGKRILNKIREFSEQYHENIFVVSCRIAAKEYVFEQFTDVELADFDDTQIADFVGNWYQELNPEKGKIFLEKMKEYPRVRELATNPLLLTMLCLLFNDSTDFPSNRSELYGQALDVLLRRWDGTRNIEREQAYKRLSLDRKKDLLSQLAWNTFDSQEYFFKQELAASQISSYIRGLPDAQTDSEALLLDGRAILQSIAAQHGLLVERARGIYSYSHLSFHEYFAAWWIVTANDTETFNKLSQHVIDRQWREVFLLATGMLRNADSLLLAMRSEIGNVVTSQPNLKQFFVWLNRKSRSITTSDTSAGVGAFYLALTSFPESIIAFSPNFNVGLDIALNTIQNNLFLDFSLDICFCCNLNLCRASSLRLTFDLTLDMALAVALKFAQDLAYSLESALARALAIAFARMGQLQFNDQILSSLKTMEAELQRLPDLYASQADSDRWRQSFHQRSFQLQQACISHRDLGHDWQFTNEEAQCLEKYILANQLLVDCMNSECYISPEVREELEKNLLIENFDEQP
jgi:predicted NACHT family NTPase